MMAICSGNLLAQRNLEKTIVENYKPAHFSDHLIVQDTLSAREAELQLYQEVLFKGKVISTFYADFERGQPLFLNIDKLFPDNPVVLVIFIDDREKFLSPDAYRGKEVLVKGKVKLYKYEFGWKSSITLTNPEQIMILEE